MDGWMDWWIRRLEDAGVDLASYDIQTILVDPPRAGLDAASLALTQQYDEVTERDTSITNCCYLSLWLCACLLSAR